MKTSDLTAVNSGVYRAPADVTAMRNAALKAGCAWMELDLGRARDKSSLLGMVAAELRFPPGFGGNWDAFADCLQDLSWLPAQGHVLMLEGGAGFAAVCPEAHTMLLTILEAVAADWRRRGRVFVVLLWFPQDLPAFPDS